MQKCDADDHCGSDQVTWSNDNAVVARALADGDVNLVGGTSWFWSRPEVARGVDVLVVDEAGQFSLANAVAVARGAESMVLLGDPQQLAQPTQAVHPGESGASALEHLLDGHATIPTERGVFLDRSYRMHPRPHPVRVRPRLRGPAGRRGGPGPGRRPRRRGPVGQRAAGAAAASHADVAGPERGGGRGRRPAVALRPGSQMARPRGLRVGDRAGAGAGRGAVQPAGGAHPVVAARGARVGTVDKFQGQEAPVVLYSMTSTSADDAPRGVSFLYDLNRLNVAISRAQALAVVVLSPELLDAPVRTPEQLRRVNALCRLVESATAIG